MIPEPKPKRNQPTAAFVISLLAGVLMLASDGMFRWAGHSGGGMGGPMMGGNGYGGPSIWFWHHEMMYTYGGGAFWWWVGIGAAVVVLVSAVNLYLMPEKRKGWGTVIMIASAAAIFAGAGGFLAGGLGLVGGGLAMGWKT